MYRLSAVAKDTSVRINSRVTVTGKSQITGIKTFPFVHEKYHVDYPGIELDLCAKNPANDLLNTTFSTNYIRRVRGGGWGVGLDLCRCCRTQRHCNFIVRATIKENEWGEGEHDWREIPLMGEFQ